MGYKFTDPDEYGNQRLDSASCPKWPDKVAMGIAYGVAGYEIARMTGRRLSESGPGRFLSGLKLMWDVPNPEQRARIIARRDR